MTPPPTQIAPLEPPDSHHLSAAEGWLELGDPAEAVAELRCIGPEHAGHPAVLELNWQIHARLGQWEICLELASRLVRRHPGLPTGWVHRSFALHELKRTEEARDQLLPAVAQFPNETVMAYNLACYECRLGNLAMARRWLKHIFARPNSQPWRLVAQQDADLAPLQAEMELL
jgi:Flp pilus assembly protein TadD